MRNRSTVSKRNWNMFSLNMFMFTHVGVTISSCSGFSLTEWKWLPSRPGKLLRVRSWRVIAVYWGFSYSMWFCSDNCFTLLRVMTNSLVWHWKCKRWLTQVRVERHRQSNVHRGDFMQNNDTLGAPFDQSKQRSKTNYRIKLFYYI